MNTGWERKGDGGTKERVCVSGFSWMSRIFNQSATNHAYRTGKDILQPVPQWYNQQCHLSIGKLLL